MNPRVKALWLSALRSGEFRQGVGFLAANGRHCAMGVLCEIAKEDGVPLAIREDDRGVLEYDDRTDVLPGRVVEWAGLNDSDPLLVTPYEYGKPTKVTRRLSDLNDGDWWGVDEADSALTFLEIADLVEAQL